MSENQIIQDPDRLFLFGRGYVARRLVRRAGFESSKKFAGVTATYRTDGSVQERGDIRFDDIPAVTAALQTATHILVSVPPSREAKTAGGDPVLDAIGAGTLNSLSRLRWVGYLSTTGVYGDHQGRWVDERSQLLATAGRSLRRKAAEQAWMDAAAIGLPVAIFRLSGIYGPGRSAIDALRRGTARRVDKPGHVFSRCHVDDICAVLEASMAAAGASGPARRRGGSAEIYNVADDTPSAQREVVEHAAALLAVPPPPLVPFGKADLSPMARSFYEANRRVRNDRIKQRLGITLAYPSYREGLAAIAAEMGLPSG